MKLVILPDGTLLLVLPEDGISRYEAIRSAFAEHRKQHPDFPHVLVLEGPLPITDLRR